MTPDSTAPVAAPVLHHHDHALLDDLARHGTSENTLRAYRRDLLYITAWKQSRLSVGLVWPELESTALTFIEDHARDLVNVAKTDRALTAATALIALGLRRSLACPAPATLNRRIATWRTFHRMRNLSSPFDTLKVRQACARAHSKTNHTPAPRSSHPITRDVLGILLSTCKTSRRDCRDRSLLMLGWASGGRRRSEISRMMREDVSLIGFEETGRVWLSVRDMSGTARNGEDKLPLNGRAAQALMSWIEVGEIHSGPLFRPISRADRVLNRQLTPDAIYQIVRYRIALAGLPDGYATPHGLRSGFLTQAALDGAPAQAAMRLSRHRSMAQVQKYYDDVTIAGDPGIDLLK